MSQQWAGCAVWFVMRWLGLRGRCYCMSRACCGMPSARCGAGYVLEALRFRVCSLTDLHLAEWLFDGLPQPALDVLRKENRMTQLHEEQVTLLSPDPPTRPRLGETWRPECLASWRSCPSISERSFASSSRTGFPTRKSAGSADIASPTWPMDSCRGQAASCSTLCRRSCRVQVQAPIERRAYHEHWTDTPQADGIRAWRA